MTGEAVVFPFHLRAKQILHAGMAMVAVLSMLALFWTGIDYPDVMGGRTAIFLLVPIVLIVTQTPLLLARWLAGASARADLPERVGRSVLLFSALIVALGVSQSLLWFLYQVEMLDNALPKVVGGPMCTIAQLALLVPPFVIWRLAVRRQRRSS